MHIVFVAPECAPRVKTGGLGEVLGALPAAVAEQGHKVAVFVPFYRAMRLEMDEQSAPAMPVVLESLTIPFAEENRFVRILDGGERNGVQSYFVDCPEFFDRTGVYGPPGENYADNALRFGLYCRAVLEACKVLGVPDVFHLHDWQAAFVAILLHTTYLTDPLLADAATVYTIHNGAYQGLFPPEQLRDLLLPERLFTDGELATEGKVNPFLGALLYSDALTTVSPSYADELKTAEYGEGLDEVYRARADSFTGILNGIDMAEWNPATDAYLVAHYSVEDLSGKRLCREDLLRDFDVGDIAEGTAVVGMVSRLAAQKGFDLVAEAMSRLAQMDLVLLIVGTGEPAVEQTFRELAERFPKHLRLRSDFSEELAHKVQGGSDMSLMPSRYEPAGLTQLYSLRYGTIPIVRATGGLRDTVQQGESGDGFTFVEYSIDALETAVRQALQEFHDTERWQARMRRGMEVDRGWSAPAREYVAVYQRAVAAHSDRRGA